MTLGEGAEEDTRRIVERDELGPDTWALAQKLADENNRLVVTAAPTPGQETAEVVHEALIRNWPALVDWVNRDRAFISWRNQLRQRLDDWHKAPSDEGTLLRGGPLAVAEEWVSRRGDDLNEEEKDFVARSVALRDAEKRRAEEELEERQAQLREVADAQGKTARLQQWARWALIAIAAVIVASAGLFYWQYSTDTRKLKAGQDQLTEARTTLSARQQQLEEAQSALRTGQTQLADAKSALEGSENNLRRQQSAATELQRSLEAKQAELQHQHADLLGELASAQLVQGNFDTALRLAAKGSEDDLALPSKSFSASSSLASLAAAVSQARWRRAFATGREAVLSAAFSPDGSRIVTASDDKTARIWDAATDKEIVVLRGHDSAVYSAVFSPDGSRIVTASGDQTARIWDAATGKEIAVVRGHDDGVNSAAFSPDGSRIVTASKDQTARIWDVATGKEIAVLRGHDDEVNSAAFSPDGSRIVTASDDETARIWDAATGKEIVVLRGHDGPVRSAAFSPVGRASSRRLLTRPPASGTPRPARRSLSSEAMTARCSPPRSAPTGRASSRRQRTRPPASGTPRPARRSLYSEATTAR